MFQVRKSSDRTTRALDPHGAGCTVYAALTRAAMLPPSRAAYYRKLRAPSQEPNPLARHLAHLTELHALGVDEATLRLSACVLTAHVDALCGPTRTLSRDLLLECVAHENAETLIEAAVLAGDRDPATLRAFAKAKRREAMLDLVCADAADHEAARGQWGAV